jgi:hypothetical protein
MTYAVQPYPRQRSIRVKLSGSILALIVLDHQRQLRAPLHQLSLNGGLLSLAEPLETPTVELMFHIGSSTLRARAETLFPMWATQGCLQPFRFAGLEDRQRRTLELDLHSLLRAAHEVPPMENVEVVEEEPSSPSQVILYFDTSRDALHFTLAVSPVIARDVKPCSREDLARLARELGKVNRVTTSGTLHRALLPANTARSLLAGLP